MSEEKVFMSVDEAEQIADEIENDDELGYDDFGDGEDEVFQEDTVTKTVTVVSQPIVTSVTVGAEVGAKGEVKPYAKLSIERHLELDGDDSETVFEVIADDFAELADMVQAELTNLKQKMNPGRPEMQ